MMRARWITLSLVLVAGSAHGARVRFQVVDPITGLPLHGSVVISDDSGRQATLPTGLIDTGETSVWDTTQWVAGRAFFDADAPVVKIPIGTTIALKQNDQRPVKEIVIHVTATRLVPNRAPVATSGTTRDRNEIQKFVSTTGGDAKNLTKGQSGVAEDSAGQQHVRGEHAEIAYVVDGVPLPDTLSGRQGSVVVPSTIQTLEMITGGYAPEFGGQTAAVLNVSTLPRAAKAVADSSISYGSYRTANGDIILQGPMGSKASYVVNLNASRTDLGLEPPQPDRQDAHNQGHGESQFAKVRLAPNSRDALTFTVSHNPDGLQVANRTGLGAGFEAAGQGYGFLGLRNADGSRPDVTPGNSGLLGAGNLVLQSQQQAGMDIDLHEVDEFAIVSYDRKVSHRDTANLALTFLHSGQEVTNGNPAVDVANLPVDSSIEFNPEAYRNVHHVQATGSYAADRGDHKFKAGFLVDAQSGHESYHIVSASQLALDALAAIAPNMAPAGTASNVLDVNGNPVYHATSSVTPTLKVSRVGTYKAAYLQDTWKASKKLTVNYGFRGDWFSQNQDLGQPSVSKFELSPRLNFNYVVDPKTELKWAYNHLFNTPPLAQGAVVGQAIQPETLDQYDVAIERKLSPGHKVELAYYYKNIKNQVDTALLIPGSQIGLYSAVNLQKGAVHGVEFSYDINSTKSYGWDGYFNYTLSAAMPNGKDNTGANVPDYNDHDQRHTVGAGLAHTWKNGATASTTVEYGSGLASSPIPPDTNRRSRSQVGLHYSSGDRTFHGHGGVSVDVDNVFDNREVINFQSAFSGTRFQMGRRVSVAVNLKF